MTPSDVIIEFGRRLGAGDARAAADLYAPGAVFVDESGTHVTGRPAIEAALTRFAALRPVLTNDIRHVALADDVALVVNRWTLDGRAPDGSAVHAEGRSTDVLCRDDSGDWRLAVDDPWGGAR
jgi:uncharacterized protein (TIGR02246 family)